MPSFRQIVYGIYGAWRLARLDPGAMAYFDRTVAGFWQSFFAAALVAPGYAILVLLDLADHEVESGSLRILSVHAAAYVIGWTAFPLAVHHICGAIGKPDAFIGYIVAFNWAKVIQLMVYLPVVAISAAEVLPTGAVSLLMAVVYLAILAYVWFITRTALAVSSVAAVGFVALDFLIDILVNGAVVGMVY